MPIPKSKLCPCGRSNTYIKCCKEVHLDLNKAFSAEDLMRSRYTAFTLGMGDYLNRSHHINTRNESEKTSIEEWAKSVKWIRLEIISSTMGGENDQKGTVEFKAHFKQGLFKKLIHENSTFIKEEGKWYYLGSI